MCLVEIQNIRRLPYDDAVTIGGKYKRTKFAQFPWYTNMKYCIQLYVRVKRIKFKQSLQNVFQSLRN